jgi:hypothetical protein
MEKGRGRLKHCEFYLIRYVPNVATGQFVNIAVFLHCPQVRFLDCLFTDDFSAVQQFHPEADLEFLRELQPHFEQEISENEKRLPAYIDGIRGSYSDLIQMSDPEPTEADDLEAKLSQLFKSYVHPERGARRRADTRMRIKRRLADALERHGLIGDRRFESDIPSARWDGPSDGFVFDFGYTVPNPAPEQRLIHALSLLRDHELVETLKMEFNRVRSRLPSLLTVAHEDIDDPSNLMVRSSREVLRDRDILLVPVAQFEHLARSIEAQLLK